MTIKAGKTEGGDALLYATSNNPNQGSRPIGWNLMEPRNVPVLAELDESGEPVRTLTPDNKPVGGLSGTVQGNLLVVEFEGESYALVPVVGNAVEANFIPRVGTLAALSTIAGEAGEIAAISDQPGFALLNGVAGGAKFIMADNAGRTLTVRVPSTGYAGGTILVTPEVQQLVVLWETQPTNRYDAGAFPTIPMQFSGARDPRRPFRVISDFSINIDAGDSGLDPLAISGSGDRIVCDFVLVDNVYRLVSRMGASSNPDLGATGTVSLGDSSGASANFALAIGSSAIADLPGMVTFGRPAYSVFANRFMVRIGGQTTGVNGTFVLRPNPSAALSESNSVRLNSILGSTTFSVRLDIIGRTNTNYVRFVREAFIHRSTGGTLTLEIPATPNTPSDILSAGAAGSSVALSVDATFNALQVQVTGPTTSQTMRWSCMLDIHAAAGL